MHSFIPFPRKTFCGRKNDEWKDHQTDWIVGNTRVQFTLLLNGGWMDGRSVYLCLHYVQRTMQRSQRIIAAHEHIKQMMMSERTRRDRIITQGGSGDAFHCVDWMKIWWRWRGDLNSVDVGEGVRASAELLLVVGGDCDCEWAREGGSFIEFIHSGFVYNNNNMHNWATATTTTADSCNKVVTTSSTLPLNSNYNYSRLIFIHRTDKEPFSWINSEGVRSHTCCCLWAVHGCDA